MKLLINLRDRCEGDRSTEVYTDPDKYYLCYNDEEGGYYTSRYLAYFKGNGNSSMYTELFVMNCSDAESQSGSGKVNIKVYLSNDKDLEYGQTYFASDTIFELTDDEVLNNIVLESI